MSLFFKQGCYWAQISIKKTETEILAEAKRKGKDPSDINPFKKKVFKLLITSKDQARAKEMEIKRMIKDGTYSQIKDSTTPIYMKDAIDVYIENYSKHYNKMWKNDKMNLEAFLAIVGNINLREITVADHINRFKFQREKEVSKQTINRQLETINGFLNRLPYLYKKLQFSNPIKGEVKKYRVKSPPPRIPSDDELVLIFRTIEKDETFTLMVLLGVRAGFRRNEIITLSLSEINFDTGYFDLKQQKTEHSANESFVNDTPIHPELEKRLKKHIKDHGITDRLFDIDKGQLSTDWNRLMSFLGLRGIQFKNLRHKYITDCARLNINPKFLSEIARHTNTKQTEHYTHFTGKEKYQIVSQVPCDFLPDK